MLTFRVLGTALAILILTALAVVVPSSPASATATCEQDPNIQGSSHCYSVMTLAHGHYIGAWGRFSRNYMTPGSLAGDSNAHINSEFWLVLTNNNYLEAGLRNGSTFPPCPPGGSLNTPCDYGPTCNCVAYSQFWADHSNVTPTSDIEYRHIIANVTPNAQNDIYQISGAGNNNWNIFLNGNGVGLSTVTGGSLAYAEQIGGEYQNTTASQGLANNFDMYTQVLTTNGQWINWNYADNTAITSCAGFEGKTWSMSPTEWSWQKHAPTC